MATHSSTLAWKIPWVEEPDRLQSMGSRRVGHDWVTSLSLFTFHFHALKKEMATHSSVLAWRIPLTGEPGGLPSVGSHRVGHDWSDLAAAAAAGVLLHSFVCGYPIDSSPFIQFTTFSTLNYFGTLANIKFTINAFFGTFHFIFWTFHFIPLIDVSIFMPVLYCLDCCRFAINLKSGSMSP